MGGQGAKTRSIAYHDDGSTPTIKSAPSGSNTVPDVVYPNKARSLCARMDSSPCVDRGQNVVCYGIDCRNLALNEEKSATIQAKNEGGHSLNFINPVCYRQDGFACYSDGVGTLKASGGDMWGGTESIIVSVYDARGNGDGITIPTLTGDHENSITDYTALCVERKVDE